MQRILLRSLKWCGVADVYQCPKDVNISRVQVTPQAPFSQLEIFDLVTGCQGE